MNRSDRSDETLLISRALERAAEEVPRRRDLPEARYFWLTAQLIPNRVVQERALRPMGWLQMLAYAIVAICWALVITWKWAIIKSWFEAPDLMRHLLDAIAGAGSVPLSFLVLVGGLLCITTVVVLHGVFAEE